LPDGAKLKNKKPLDEAGKYLEENSFGLAVVASSESKGDTDKARILSDARAKVVRDYLTQNFKLEEQRLKTIGLDKTTDAGDSSKLVIMVSPESRHAPPGSTSPPSPEIQDSTLIHPSVPCNTSRRSSCFCVGSFLACAVR
jgi:hypothetical protein